MKKIFFMLLFLLSASMYAQAQVCTPDVSITEPGMHPDSLPDATAGVNYNETIQFKFPSDTTYNGVTIPIDSVKIYKVEKMPASFSYQCNNGTCQYAGGQNGCVVFTGSPNSSQVGNYQIKITALAKATFGGTSVWIPFQDSLSFHIKSSSGLFQPASNRMAGFSLKGNYPDPFSASTRIVFNSPAASAVTLQVYNMLGTLVYSQTIKAQSGENALTLERQGWKQGLYLYSLELGAQALTGKMMIKD